MKFPLKDESVVAMVSSCSFAYSISFFPAASTADVSFRACTCALKSPAIMMRWFAVEVLLLLKMAVDILSRPCAFDFFVVPEVQVVIQINI